MSDFNNYHNSIYLREHIFDGEFGLEKESLRVTPKGLIANTPHPFGDIENITRDFSEAQLEFITSIHTSAEGAINELSELHKTAYEKLSKLETGKEFIWCFSNPPIIDGENSVSVAQFTGELRGKVAYRNYLAKKYGKRKMLLSGIHLNFSFPEKLVNEMFMVSSENNFRKFKDSLYLNIASRLIEYSWLIVVLTASSPVCDSSFVGNEKGKTFYSNFSTIRCGANGYWNTFTPYIDYSSIKTYTESIRDYVQQGLLRAESELYCPVRLKPKGQNSLDLLLKNGVNHLEFRLLDVNPLYKAGINPDDIKFIHLLIIYFLTLDKTNFNRQNQKLLYENIKNSAVYDITPFKENGIKVLNNIKKCFGNNIPNDYKKALDFQINKLIDEDNLYSHIVMEKYGKDYIGKGLETAEYYSNELRK